MTERDFKVGDVVTIIGRGEVQIHEISTNVYGDTVYLGKHHGLGSEWFNRDELDGLAAISAIIRRRQESFVRGADCTSPDCWCRGYVL